MTAGLAIPMRRRGDTLVPTSAFALEDLHTIPDGREIIAMCWRSRSPQHHRWFFAMLKNVIDAGYWSGDIDQLLDYIKIGLGYVETIIGPDGRPYYKVKSIAFASMDQGAFGEFVDKALALLAERLQVDVDAIAALTTQAAGNWREKTDSPSEPHTASQARETPSAVVDSGQGRERAPEPPGPQRGASLHERLTALADELGRGETIEAVQSIRKASDEFTALARLDSATVAKLYEAAKNKARGKLDEQRYRAATRAIIEGAG